MARFHAGSTITLTQSVRVDDVLTDAAAIRFFWKEGLYGAQAEVAPTRTATGTYEVSITPTIGGDLYYRWDTEGALDTAQEGVISVAPSQFTL